MTYWDNFLPGPFPLERYKQYLPEFLSAKEKESYQIELKRQPEDWRYRHKKITYILNQDHYRTKEWNDIDWANSVVVFGCSHVFGEGNSVDEGVCAQLEQIIGLPVINMGVTGSSPAFSWHNSLILDRKYPTPKGVVQLWSGWNRLPYYSETICKRIGPWSGSEWDEYDYRARQFYELFNESERHVATTFYFDAYACESFWRSKTRYAHGSYFEPVAAFMNIDFYPGLDWGRDMIHYGHVTHKMVAENIAKQLGY